MNPDTCYKSPGATKRKGLEVMGAQREEKSSFTSI